MNQILKYPGSKTRLAKQIAGLFPEHHSYLEPFCGSCAVLMSKQPSKIETINDLSGDIINLFRCIKEDPEKLASEIFYTPYSRQEYIASFTLEEDNFAKARQFLTRCWQGHGFRTVGSVVGWKNDVQGREKAYALSNWNRLPEWIINCAWRFKAVQIENQDAIKLIKRFNYQNVLIYADPPYLISTRSSKRKQYEYEMTEADHVELISALHLHKGPVAISGYQSAVYDELLVGWHKEVFKGYKEHQGNNGSIEVLWMNYNFQHQIDELFTAG